MNNPVGMQIVMIVALFAIMYFLLIRPQKKREKQIAEMRSNVKVGDDIVTIGGIYGKVVKVKEDKLTIQVGADKTKFDIAKWAISKVENAAPGSKKKTVDDIEAEEEKPKKVSPKKMKKLGGAEAPEAEAVEAAAEVISEEPAAEAQAEAPVAEEEPIR